jgi:hypothetical protein
MRLRLLDIKLPVGTGDERDHGTQEISDGVRASPPWVALTGYGCGLVLLLVIANWKWITLVFPIWMLIMSTQILLSELNSGNARRRGEESRSHTARP